MQCSRGRSREGEDRIARGGQKGVAVVEVPVGRRAKLANHKIHEREHLFCRSLRTSRYLMSIDMVNGPLTIGLQASLCQMLVQCSIEHDSSRDVVAKVTHSREAATELHLDKAEKHNCCISRQNKP